MTLTSEDLMKIADLATQITVAAVSSGKPSTVYSESGKETSEYFEAVFKKIKELLEV